MYCLSRKVKGNQMKPVKQSVPITKLAKLSLIIHSLYFVGGYAGLAHAAVIDSPFADIPLHFQNSVSASTAGLPKPNVLFLVDTSNTMLLGGGAATGWLCNKTSICVATNENGTCKERWGVARLNASQFEKTFYFEKPEDTDYEKYEGCQQVTLGTGRTGQYDSLLQYNNRLQFRDSNGLIRGVAVGSAISQLVARYRDQMYIGFATTHGLRDKWLNNRNGAYTTYRDFSQITTSDPANGRGYRDFVGELMNLPYVLYGGNSPLISAYYDAADNIVIKQHKYRCQKSYIVFLSDGDLNDSYISGSINHGYFGSRTINWKSKTGEGIGYFSKILSEKSFGSYLSKTRPTDNAGSAWTKPSPVTNQPYQQTATTYSILFGSSNVASGAEEFLRRAASDNKYFYKVTSGQQLFEAFKAIFQNIEMENRVDAVSAYATTVPGLVMPSQDNQDLAIVATINTGSWTSELKTFSVANNASNGGKQVAQNNDAKISFDNRKVILSDGNGSVLYKYGQLKDNNTYGNLAYFNLRGGNADNEWSDGLLAWYAREGSSDSSLKKSGFALDYRDRGEQRQLGDILDNPILGIGNYMVTSANDGMVYAFRKSGSGYDLKFNFMPMAMDRQSNDGSNKVADYYKDLLDNKYGQVDRPHRYLLNGGMVLRQTDKSAPQQVFLASTMGQAGRGAFAINIGGKNVVDGTDIAIDDTSDDWYQKVKLFETPKGSANQFGYTVGTPAIARVRVNQQSGSSSEKSVNSNIRQAVFVANGYNYTSTLATDQKGKLSSETALYIYDALGVDVGKGKNQQVGDEKGTLIKKISVNGSGGLSSPTVVDMDFDGVADVVYAGDYSGNLWRFDLRHTNPSNWTAVKIFTAKTNQHITSAPAVFRRGSNRYVVVFGTGSAIYQDDLTDQNTQSVYGIYDDLTNSGTEALVSVNDLLKQENKLISSASTSGQRLVTSNPFDQTQHKGWYYDLPDKGERVVSKPIIMNKTVVISTRVYQTSTTTTAGDAKDVCSPDVQKTSAEAYSWIDQVGVLTGAGIRPNTDESENSTYINFGATYTNSGLKMTSLVTLTFVDKSLKGSARDFNGDTGGSGIDPELVEGGQRYNNLCTSRSNAGKNYVLSVSQNDDPQAYAVSDEICKTVIKRLSWREIY